MTPTGRAAKTGELPHCEDHAEARFRPSQTGHLAATEQDALGQRSQKVRMFGKQEQQGRQQVQGSTARTGSTPVSGTARTVSLQGVRETTPVRARDTSKRLGLRTEQQGMTERARLDPTIEQSPRA